MLLSADNHEHCESTRDHERMKVDPRTLAHKGSLPKYMAEAFCQKASAAVKVRILLRGLQCWKSLRDAFWENSASESGLRRCLRQRPI